jgi:hypothetical protein
VEPALVEIVLLCFVVLHIFQMEGEVWHVKRARMMSQNQIRNIVMDSDSDEEAYYISTDTEDEHQPRPPSPILKPASRDYSASSSKDEEGVDNVAGRQPQPSQWTLPPKPQRHVVHTFTGAAKGKSIPTGNDMTAFSCPNVLMADLCVWAIEFLPCTRIVGPRGQEQLLNFIPQGEYLNFYTCFM